MLRPWGWRFPAPTTKTSPLSFETHDARRAESRPMTKTAIHHLADYDRYCEGRLENPYPLYHRLRTEDPVHWSDRLQSWMLTRYDDVLSANRDRRLASNRVSVNLAPLTEADRNRYKGLGDHVSNWLGFTDPPKHTRMRDMIGQTFNQGLAESQEDRIREIVDGLIEKFRKKGEIDLVDDFAYPLPATLICDILGVPGGYRRQFRVLVEDLTAFVGAVGPTLTRVAEKAERSRRELTAFFRELASERRREPRQDLISTLAAVEGKKDGLTEEELLGLIVFIFDAGHDTTASFIANGTLSLLRNPVEMARLRQHPTLMDTAVEEFLRYESPIQFDTRLATSDLEIGGKCIREGQTVILLRGAANRDPERFPDPDRLDLGRQDNKHLAFGWGAHFCLGAPLARLEGRVAFSRLLDAFPDLRLKSEQIDWVENMSLRCPRSLPVTFGGE